MLSTKLKMSHANQPVICFVLSFCTYDTSGQVESSFFP